MSVPGALACLRLVLQSLCDFFHLLLLCWTSLTGPFLSAGKGVLWYLVPKWYFSLINVESGFHCLRSFSFLDDLSREANAQMLHSLVINWQQFIPRFRRAAN
jgi:hypothetical protein